MSLFQPKELMAFLESIGHKPSKKLSQNFLIDGNILKKIIAAGNVTHSDVVIEIGPGPGVLTEALLKEGAHVLAIEKDSIFAKALSRLKVNGALLEVFEQDVLEFPLESYLNPLLKEGQKAKVISNLPYHLTSPILGKLLPLYASLETVIVMVQKEVADRMVAKPHSKDYGSFSIFTQFYSNPTLLFRVSPHCFYPEPKVTSAIVACHLSPPQADIDPSLFFKFIKRIFSMRRKMITTSLKEVIPHENLIEALSSLHIKMSTRPEELSLSQLLELFSLIEKHLSL